MLNSEIANTIVALLLGVALAGFTPASGQQSIFKTTDGTIHFKSDAPLEFIEARSRKLLGAIDPAKSTFAFTVEIQSFQGFNSALQREHFNENYLESQFYPKASFVGRIIEEVDYEKEGRHRIRAKGKLTIHGVEQERIIKSDLIIKDGKLEVEANFTVLLQEHNIRIPHIVHQKIAEEIQVSVHAIFERVELE